MTSSAQLAYRFNGFRVDPVRRLLFGADGEPISLKPEMFDTLLYIQRLGSDYASRRALAGGQVVDRKEPRVEGPHNQPTISGARLSTTLKAHQ